MITGHVVTPFRGLARPTQLKALIRSNDMTTSSLKIAGFMIATLAVTVVLHAQSPSSTPAQSAKEKRAVAEAKAREANRVSVDMARYRAKLMHDIYDATLDVMHHRYFRGDRAIVPARAMEDVFSQIQRKSSTEARWISVNLKPMSLDHTPETEFEKHAAKVLATGKSEVEAIQNGFYRRATPIPLTGGCLSCHGGLFRQPSETPKYAGLVISVPVHGDIEKPRDDSDVR